MGSLIVNPGCTYYGFNECFFEETVYEYTAGLYSLLEPPAHDQPSGCANYFSSVKCRCQQKLVSCIPEDEWAVKLVCNGTGATEPVECSYMKTIGTSYTAETSDHMSISEEVSYEITAGLFGLFEETLGLSVETGYDWTQTSSETMDEAESFQVDAVAPPGRILYIEQVIPVTGHIHRPNSITRAPLRLCGALIISFISKHLKNCRSSLKTALSEYVI